MINFQYQIISKIGEGRSQVFKAYDAINNNYVALKVLSKSRTEYEHELIRDEYYFLSSFNHPNIVQAYNYGKVLFNHQDDWQFYRIAENDTFISLEYVEGKSLDNYWDSFDEKLLNELIVGVCSVLQYLHQSNLVYCDLKPENILIQSLQPFRIKIIDFDLTRYINDSRSQSVFGTSSYIPPELINLERINQTADLYSLGVLLYRIIYRKFPVSYLSNLEEIKSSITKQDSNNEEKYSELLRNAVARLLSKSPSSRFSTTFHFLQELKLRNILDNSINDVFIKYFDANGVLQKIQQQLGSQENKKPIELFGEKGTGKSRLLKELAHNNPNVILLQKNELNNGMLFGTLIQKIISHPKVFSILPKEKIIDIISEAPSFSELSYNQLNKITALLYDKYNLIVLLDDYDEIDSVTKETLSKVIPLLNSKNVLTVSARSSFDIHKQPMQNNATLFFLLEIPHSEIKRFLNDNLASFLPLGETENILHLLQRLYWQDIIYALSQIINKNSLITDAETTEFILDKTAIEEKIFLSAANITEQLNSFSETDTELLKLFLIFNKPITESTLKCFINNSFQIKQFLDIAIKQNLLSYNNVDNTYRIFLESVNTSLSKILIIEKDFRKATADKMATMPEAFSHHEVAVQYEKAEHFSLSYSFYQKEIINALDKSAYNYAATLLYHISKFPLFHDYTKKIRLELAKTLFAIGKSQECANVIEELLPLLSNPNEEVNVLLLKGEVEIALGNYQSAQNIFSALLLKKLTDFFEIQTKINLADTNLYLSNFKVTIDICNSLLQTRNMSSEQKGRVNNILALAFLFETSNYQEAIIHFNKAISEYVSENKLDKIAGIKINLGNIYAMNLSYEKAKEAWNDALQLNEAIGNLEQEAKLLLNYGILSFDLGEFENSKKQYLKALSIFESIGDKKSKGLTILNLGEVYSASGSYKEAENCFVQAEKTLKDINDNMELVELYFVAAKHYFITKNESALTNLFRKFLSVKQSNIILSSANKYEPIISGLLLILSKQYEMALLELSKSLTNFSLEKDREDQLNYFFILFNCIECCLQMSMYGEAKVYANHCTIENRHPLHNLLQAEKEYLSGVYSLLKYDKDPTPYFEEAINLLADFPVTILCAKVFLTFSEYYHLRGNTYKAEKFFNISFAIFEKIFSNEVDHTTKHKFILNVCYTKEYRESLNNRLMS